MSDDRRYKQRGYQEDDRRSSRPPAQGLSPEGRRIPVITAYKETVRCAECGQDLSTAFDIGMESRCPKCGADLHTCRNCRHFDTASRFECSQPIKERIRNKGAANLCALFTPRSIVVKELGQAAAAPLMAPAAASSQPANEARAALEKLFKK